jgi:polar amino acid transport system substrate-binding protein
MCALKFKCTQYSWLRAVFLQLGLLAILLWPVGLFVQQASSPPPPDEELVVAAAHCPPFVISENGKLSGLAIYLWERLAVEIGVSYQLVEVDFAKMLEAIANQETSHQMDVGISCLSVTAEREKTIDFSHSFYETYTGIAVHDEGVTGTLRAALTNPIVLRALLFVLVMALLAIGSTFLIAGVTAVLASGAH